MMKKNKKKQIIKNNIDNNDILLLHNYLINNIEIFRNIYIDSLNNIEFVVSFLWNNPLKKKKNEIKRILKYLDEKDKKYIDDLINIFKKNNFNKTTLEDLVKEKVMMKGYNYNDKEIDHRDIIREEIIARKEIIEELLEISKYLNKKLNKKFITKKVSKKDPNTKLLIDKYNKELARLKYLFLVI